MPGAVSRIAAGGKGPAGGKKLNPVDGNIGQLLLQVIVHQVFVFVFGVLCAAGPAAEVHPGSGAPDKEGAAAVQAFFF